MITIDDPEVERLAHELAARSGQSVANVVGAAVRARAAALSAVQEASPAEQARRAAVLERIQREVASLPILDTRSADEILGYDENGLPT